LNLENNNSVIKLTNYVLVPVTYKEAHAPFIGYRCASQAMVDTQNSIANIPFKINRASFNYEPVEKHMQQARRHEYVKIP
jgi:hypothetical protein